MPDADLRRKRNSFLDQINDLVKFKKKSRRDPEVVDLQDKIRKIDYAMSHKKESVEEVESITELTAEEKRLVNTMYDKKGNLTAGRIGFGCDHIDGRVGLVEHMEPVGHQESTPVEIHCQYSMSNHLNEMHINTCMYTICVRTCVCVTHKA